MVYCCVLGCKNRSERCENITFHTFPRDTYTRKLWIQSTGLHGWRPTKYSRICSRHFEQQCFRRNQQRTLLKKNSIPTLHTHCALEYGDDIQEEERIFAIGSPAMVEADNPAEDDSTSSNSDTLDAESNSPQSKVAEVVTPGEKKLKRELQIQTLLAESRRKKIRALRSNCRRQKIKHEELYKVINTLVDSLQSDDYIVFEVP